VSDFDSLKVAQLKTYWTDSEKRYADSRRYGAEHLAARWAVKRAFFRLFGFRAKPEDYGSLEILHRKNKKPDLKIKASLKKKIFKQKKWKWQISLAHEREMAIGAVWRWIE